MDEKGPEEGVNPQSIADVEKEHGKHSGVANAAHEAKDVVDPSHPDLAEDDDDSGVARELEFVGASVEELGLNTLIFNTFRVGKKLNPGVRNIRHTSEWIDVTEGEVLSLILVNGDERSVIGNAVVMARDNGGLDDMLDKHVGLNHGVRNIRHASDQRTKLSILLSKVYNKRLTNNDTAVVLYLSRFGD